MPRKPKTATTVIEKGVPTPPRAAYPYRDMKPGDSIVVTGKWAHSAAHNWARMTGWQFTMRRQDSNSVRVWRVA
jgi:hypothetical protein